MNRPDIESVLTELRRGIPADVPDIVPGNAVPESCGPALFRSVARRLTHPRSGLRRLLGMARNRCRKPGMAPGRQAAEPVADADLNRLIVESRKAPGAAARSGRIAFVAPFYGAEASGGAESECRNTAIRLAHTGLNVEIITTCARDLAHGWDTNHYEPGIYNEDGLTVRRFPAHRFDHAVFNGINERLVAGRPVDEKEERLFAAMHCSSMAMLEYIGQSAASYDRLVFIPYPYGTTLYGARIRPDRSILIPCLHDEGYARLDAVRSIFRDVAGIVFHTQAERRLAERLYGDLGGRSTVLGEGVDTGLVSDGTGFRAKYSISGPLILYAGRRAREKGVDELLAYFEAYARRNADPPSLALIGPGGIPVPRGARAYVRDLGFIPQQDKNNAYSAADVFCMPSRRESFSIVMMEAWLCGTPCLVHGGCEVTRDHVTESGGGLYYSNYGEFEACLKYLAGNAETRRQMGDAGRSYVRDNFAWPRIIDRYRTEIFGNIKYLNPASRKFGADARRRNRATSGEQTMPLYRPR